MRRRQVALVAFLTAISAGTALAQLPGIPYYPTPTGTGVSAAADYGNPEGPGSAVAVTGGLGVSRLGFTASVGRLSPGGNVDAEVMIGGTAALHLVGGGLNPLSIGAQVGASSIASFTPGGSRTTAIMPALQVRLSPPLFPLKPFAVGYYVLGDNVEEEVGVTVGANFNLLLGLGLHAAYDWRDSGTSWGVGAHFNFRLPGLPGM
jgi:hypothetical protein